MLDRTPKQTPKRRRSGRTNQINDFCDLKCKNTTEVFTFNTIENEMRLTNYSRRNGQKGSLGGWKTGKAIFGKPWLSHFGVHKIVVYGSLNNQIHNVQVHVLS
jgi:protein tyrosine/serine phosphatase